MTHIDAMKQVVVYFEHMVRTLQLRDESEPAQLLFKLRQAIKDAEGKENALRALHAENERLGLYKDAYGKPVIDKSAAVRIATALGWEPKREPLTDEQIDSIWREHLHRDSRVRAIEAAHGIKGEA